MIPVPILEGPGSTGESGSPVRGGEVIGFSAGDLAILGASSDFESPFSVSLLLNVLLSESESRSAVSFDPRLLLLVLEPDLRFRGGVFSVGSSITRLPSELDLAMGVGVSFGELWRGGVGSRPLAVSTCSGGSLSGVGR